MSGTPTTLAAAIRNAASSIEASIKDYLSQYFTAALLNCDGDPETEKAIADLWERITKTD